MACSYITPAAGHQRQKKCREPISLGEFCANHQPKPVSVAVTPVTLTWRPFTKGPTVDATFQTSCDNAKKRIDAICSNGPHSGGMAFTGTGDKGPYTLLHDTQPGANNTVFYRWEGTLMEVFGVGGHTGSAGNKNYGLTWFNGSNAAVDLGKKTIT